MSAGPAAAAGDGDDDLIRELAPGLWRALSALGRRVRQPADFLPQQTAEARGKTFNATIGQITDGHGRAVELPVLAAALRALPEAERSRALLYSPLEGLPELRRLWRELAGSERQPLPLITSGPGLARQVLAELFVEEGRTVILALPAGAEIEGAGELFELRRGARLVALPAAARGGGPDPGALAAELADLPAGEPAVVLFAGRADERLVEALAAAAERRPIVVLVEDAPGDPAEHGPAAVAADPAANPAAADAAGLGGGRLFQQLAGRHPDLVPFRIEGAAKLGFPGAGLGFLTLPFPAEAPLALAIEKKLRMLLRAAVGSPPALTQVLLLEALSPP